MTTAISEPITGPSNVGHPHRDPVTGLVDEDHAYCRREHLTEADWAFIEFDYGDDDEAGHGAYGDGKSIVAADVEESASSSCIATLTIRPRPSQAPKDATGYPIPGLLVTTQVWKRTREELVSDLVNRGLTEVFVAKLFTAAATRRAAAAQLAAATAACRDFVRNHADADTRKVIDLLEDPDLSHRTWSPVAADLNAVAPDVSQDRLARILRQELQAQCR